MTAEDVVAGEHRRARASRTRRRSGWDQHFGYGLPDLGLALERIDAGQDPAAGADHLARLVRAAQRRPAGRRRRSTRGVSANRAAASYTLRRLQWAPGIEPAEADFQDVAHGARDDARPTARSARSTSTAGPRRARRAPERRRRPVRDADRALRKGPGDKDPNEPAFTVRVVVTDTAGNRGEDRKVLFAYRDTTLHQGCVARTLGTRRRGVAAAVRPERRQQARHGPGRLERRAAACSTPTARRSRASTAASRCTPRLYPNVHPGAPSYGSRRPAARGAAHARDRRHRRRPRARDRRLRRASTSTPGTPTARPCPGFPVRLDPALLAAAGPHARTTTSSAASSPRPRSAT